MTMLCPGSRSRFWHQERGSREAAKQALLAELFSCYKAADPDTRSTIRQASLALAESDGEAFSFAAHNLSIRLD